VETAKRKFALNTFNDSVKKKPTDAESGHRRKADKAESHGSQEFDFSKVKKSRRGHFGL
jgi:hypothetical protein